MNRRFCNGMVHVIKEGENLYQLSRAYKVPLALILRANPYVDVYNLQVGQELCIPVARPFGGMMMPSMGRPRRQQASPVPSQNRNRTMPEQEGMPEGQEDRRDEEEERRQSNENRRRGEDRRRDDEDRRRDDDGRRRDDDGRRRDDDGRRRDDDGRRRDDEDGRRDDDGRRRGDDDGRRGDDEDRRREKRDMREDVARMGMMETAPLGGTAEREDNMDCVSDGTKSLAAILRESDISMEQFFEINDPEQLIIAADVVYQLPNKV